MATTVEGTEDFTHKYHELVKGYDEEEKYARYRALVGLWIEYGAYPRHRSYLDNDVLLDASGVLERLWIKARLTLSVPPGAHYTLRRTVARKQKEMYVRLVREEQKKTLKDPIGYLIHTFPPTTRNGVLIE